MYRLFLLLLAAAMCPLSVSVAQTPASTRDCNARDYRVNDLASYAEWKEQKLANASTDYINPGQNGSIRVHAWSQPDVLVRACVHTAAPSESQARQLAAQLSIAKGSGSIEPSGPSRSDDLLWDVSYEVWLPTSANLHVEAHNGSISVDGVSGQTRFHTENGSVYLTGVAGDVEGSTQNGSVSIELAGTRWNGHGLRAQTTNGSVHLDIPDNFSANVQASTVNGKLRIDFPITVQGEIGRNAEFQLGDGGPLIEARSVNGSVTISRKS